MDLVEQLSIFLGCPKDKLYVELSNRENYEKISALLKNVKIKTNHLRKDKKIIYKGLTFMGAKDIFIFDNILTVYQYYYIKHDIQLTYPELPCMISVDDIFYPLEALNMYEDNDFSSLLGKG